MVVLAYEYMFAEWVVGVFFLKTQDLVITWSNGAEFDLGLNVVYNVIDVVVATRPSSPCSRTSRR